MLTTTPRHPRRYGAVALRNPLILTGLAASLVILVVVAGAVVVDDFGAHVFRDPAVIPGIGPMTGAMSALGIMLWAASAAVALFSASMLEGRGRSFMTVLGTASVCLAVDDQFMLHEGLADDSSLLGQVAYVLVYGVAALGIGVAWRDCFPGRHLVLLIAAMSMFGLSIAADAVAEFVEQPVGLQTAIEDSLKYVGIAYWTAFITLRARSLVMGQRHSICARTSAVRSLDEVSNPTAIRPADQASPEVGVEVATDDSGST